MRGRDVVVSGPVLKSYLKTYVSHRTHLDLMTFHHLFLGTEQRLPRVRIQAPSREPFCRKDEKMDIKEHREAIGADGVHVGSVDKSSAASS